MAKWIRVLVSDEDYEDMRESLRERYGRPLVGVIELDEANSDPEEGRPDESVGANELIGFLSPGRTGHFVVCHNCARPEEDVPVFRANVEPYGQHCRTCGAVLVEGGKGWPELFDGR